MSSTNTSCSSKPTSRGQSFGSYLKEARTKSGGSQTNMTQEKLADSMVQLARKYNFDCKTSRHYISRLENDEYTPSFTTLILFDEIMDSFDIQKAIDRYKEFRRNQGSKND